MLYPCLMFLVMVLVACTSFSNVNDADADLCRRCEACFAVAAAIIAYVSSQMFGTQGRTGIIVLMVAGTCLLVLMALFHMYAQGGRREQVMGVYMGCNKAEGKMARDIRGRQKQLYEPVFEYEYYGETYCTASHDLFFSSRLKHSFSRKGRYQLWVNPEDPWDYQCLSRNNQAMLCLTLATVFLVLMAVMVEATQFDVLPPSLDMEMNMDPELLQTD